MNRSEIVRIGMDKTFIAHPLTVGEEQEFVVPSESVIYVRSLTVRGQIYIDGILKVIG